MKTRADVPVILALLCLGVLVSLYAINLHFSTGSSICNINDRINCDVVNKSQYSVFLGVPVAIFGFLAYLLLVPVVIYRKRIASLLSFSVKDIWDYLLGFATVMLLFQIYLSGIEVFVLKTYCIACIASQIIIILLLVFVWRARRGAL